MKTTYLAARFHRRPELEQYVPLFNKAGFDITARWVFGGEEGLLRSDISIMDLEDVKNADVMVLFTEEYGVPQSGGGRFVEFGYAMALGKECYVIGDYENVFMHDPSVKVYPTLGAFLRDQTKQP